MIALTMLLSALLFGALGLYIGIAGVLENRHIVLVVLACAAIGAIGGLIGWV